MKSVETRLTLSAQLSSVCSFLIFFIHRFAVVASLKNLGDKAAGLFEKKKKEAGDIASEKVQKATKAAEDQVNKTSDALSGVTSGAGNLIAGASKDVDDTKKKAGKLMMLQFK